MSGGQNNSRPTSMTYPNGRVLDYVYNTGLDSAISRVSAIVDDGTSTTLESYAYLGLGTIVAWNHPQSGVNLTYIEQAGDTSVNTDGGDQYTGLDRFGRVIDQNWVNASTGVSTVRYQYGYDRAGDVLYRADLVETALSELYHANSAASSDNASAYDALGRLTGFARGTLSSSGNNGTTLDTISSASASQSWGLDALGNQVGVTTNGTTVTQGFNTLDQQTSTSSGTAPTYDADGNTLTSGGLSYVYDAWNRLVGVSTTATSAAVASYTYDATGRRIEESYSGGSTNYLYYSPSWQVIEERQGGTAASNVHYQYVMGVSGNLVLRDTYVSGTIVSADRLYAEWDANGDITAITNASGTVEERYAYSAYGMVTVLTASGTPVTGNVSAYGWQYLFQGGRRDAATGLYIFEHRDYDPTSGVWMERDPMGLAARDENIYRFVGNDPAIHVDPSGLMPNKEGVITCGELYKLSDRIDAENPKVSLRIKLAYLNSLMGFRYLRVGDQWIDTHHFLSSALPSVDDNSANFVYSMGVAVEDIQKAMTDLALILNYLFGKAVNPRTRLGNFFIGNPASAYTIEDLYSDKQGTLFGVFITKNQNLSLTDSLKKFLDPLKPYCGDEAKNTPGFDKLPISESDWQEIWLKIQKGKFFFGGGKFIKFINRLFK